MLSPLRNRFGIPGVISVIALVFAMLGGAYAASNDSGGDGASASAKAKQGPRGPRGKTGPAGPAGPAGAQGLPGAAGANGKDGANGANGKDGAPGDDGDDGKSVVMTPANEVTECPDVGGALVEVEGSGEPTEVCNGEDGSPWTAGGTLPAGSTLTGTWSFSTTAADPILVPISFPIPLAAAEGIPVENVHFQPPNVPGEAKTKFEEFCAPVQNGVSNPKADPGHLCIYFSDFGSPPTNAEFDFVARPTYYEEGPSPGEAATGKAGALLRFTFTGAPGTTAHGSGTFAVTG